jgi:enamine deaminase RidA (YjgF/YER057c/UK114 family)
MTSQATKRKSINPGATQALYDALHFSQATRVGNALWVSGQVGIDAAMKPADSAPSPRFSSQSHEQGVDGKLIE